MNEVMKHWYEPLPPEQRPRVLGLTVCALRRAFVAARVCVLCVLR
jgi:hypothetical protein